MTQAAYDDPRPFKIHRDRRGSPAWFQRPLEAWWILTGRWSLHRAWQAGKDKGGIDEWRRIIVNGGDLHPIMRASVEVTYRHAMDADVDPDVICHLTAAAWKRYCATSSISRPASNSEAK